jgi:hypothetical protein
MEEVGMRNQLDVGARIVGTFEYWCVVHEGELQKGIVIVK